MSNMVFCFLSPTTVILFLGPTYQCWYPRWADPLPMEAHGSSVCLLLALPEECPVIMVKFLGTGSHWTSLDYTFILESISFGGAVLY